MNLAWTDVLTELMFSHRVSLATAVIWAVGRWVRGVRSGRGPAGRTEWWMFPPLLWAMETVQQSWLMWESSVWEPSSLVAFSALVNAANVIGLLVVLLLVAIGMTAAPRLQIRPLAVIGALAAVAGAFFARLLLLWGGTVGLAARIEGAL